MFDSLNWTDLNRPSLSSRMLSCRGERDKEVYHRKEMCTFTLQFFGISIITQSEINTQRIVQIILI